jgi:ubiquitin-like 1-activating enzyme E1 A
MKLLCMTAKSASGVWTPSRSTARSHFGLCGRVFRLPSLKSMRNATVLVVKIRGVATETIKNIVLSGIGKLIVLDDEIVQPEDLGAGFFYRSEDVNVKKRVHAAKPHIESLNPLVAVEVLDDASILYNDEQLERLLSTVNLVCLTDSPKDLAVSTPVC